MFATMNSGKVVFTLIYLIFSCFSFSLMSCNTDSDIQGLRAALNRAEEREAEVTAELKDTKAELERVKVELRSGIPENEQKRIIELEKLVENKQKRIVELEKLVEKVPQATIEKVKIDQKNNNMDIHVTFSIENRKDIECFVIGSLYQRRTKIEKFQKLENKNGDPISISERFTPKRVTETQTVKLSISYAELNVTQRRELRFTFDIYDRPTGDFLNAERYSELYLFDP